MQAPSPAKKTPATTIRRTAKPAASSHVGPFVQVHFAAALHKKVVAVLVQVEASEDATQHRDALAKVVIELLSAGLDYCFMQPLKQAQPGFLVQQSAGLGMAGAVQVQGTVIRNIISRMDHTQMLSVCISLRQMVRDGEQNERR